MALTLSQAVERLIKKYGGVRALARASGVDPGYISKLREGRMTNPSEHVLFALGIMRKTTYSIQRDIPLWL